MKYSERQQRNKEKTQARLRRLVEQSGGQGAPDPSAPGASAPGKSPAKTGSSQGKGGGKKTPSAKGQAPARKNRKKDVQKNSGKKPVQKSGSPSQPAAYKPAGRDTAVRLRDTISDYRSRPMSKRKKQRRNVLYYSLIAIILLAVFIISSLTVLFNIMDIEVDGNLYYTEEQIITQTGIETERNMFRLNLRAISERLTKQLPYIKSAVISRKLPDTIVIKIVEAIPAGVIEFEGAYIIIDADSKVLERVGERPENLMLIESAPLQHAVPGETAVYENADTQKLIQILCEQLIANRVFSGVTSLNVEKRYSLFFVYNETVTCQLGDTEKIDVKLAMIERVLSENDAAIVATVDATDPNRVYYRPEFSE